MTDHEAYIAFNLVPDVGSVKVDALAKSYGGVAAAWAAFPEKKASLPRVNATNSVP